MHVDVRPFAPFSAASPWLQAVTIETLQWLCVLAGAVGVAGLALLRWRELRVRGQSERL